MQCHTHNHAIVLLCDIILCVSLKNELFYQQVQFVVSKSPSKCLNVKPCRITVHFKLH